jgi:hypothetical protein
MALSLGEEMTVNTVVASKNLNASSPFVSSSFGELGCENVCEEGVEERGLIFGAHV